MNQRILRVFIFVLIPLLAASGCGMIVDDQRQENINDLFQTSVAQTQDAQYIVETIVAGTLTGMPPDEDKQVPTEEAATEVIPSPTPSETASPQFIPTATWTLVPTLTATATWTLAPTLTATATWTLAPSLTATAASSVPLVEVSVPTNCRTGPGKIYDQVSVLGVGKRVEVVARNASGTYWVVENPGGSGMCWLWGQYATLTGSTANLPVWDAPPTPTPAPGLTPTATGVVLQVSIPTNCRVGPGKAYEIVSVLSPGKTVKVIARHATADFWVVENPEGSGHCWVWGEYATLTGSTANLPVWDAPPTPTPVTGNTPTPTGVTLQVSIPTNCRVGPGKPYEIVSVLSPGKTVKVIARHATADFWVVENPEGSGHCWVWGEYATLTGSTSNLPIWDPPPTPTPVTGNTPTPTGVTLQVSIPTNCRVGPGKPYEIVSVLRPGKTVKVIARHATADFWVVENPEGSGHCWVWGEYASLTGPTANLPVWNPPATPTPTK